MHDSSSLTGHLLIAMPAMEDPNFHRTVSYICEHNENGALGLVINRPMDIDMGQIFEQLALTRVQAKDPEPSTAREPVLCGGPVETQRGFVLHSDPGDWETTVAVSDEIHVTTSQDVLSAMAAGKGPDRAVVALGYAGWSPGQLEHELVCNTWINVPASPHIIFDTPFEDRWQGAANLLGFDIATVSSEVGHA